MSAKDLPIETKVERLRTLVQTIMESIVDHEDCVRIDMQHNHRRVMFTIRVHDADFALALGSKRRCTNPQCSEETRAANATAMRTLLIAACRKLAFRCDVDIVGPNGDVDWSS